LRFFMVINRPAVFQKGGWHLYGLGASHLWEWKLPGHRLGRREEPCINTRLQDLQADKYTHILENVHRVTLVTNKYTRPVVQMQRKSCLNLGMPAVAADERHEHAGVVLTLFEGRTKPLDNGEVLVSRGADREH
jgi:hypothetical protein